MAQLYSFHNEAREIYRVSRRRTDLLIKAGKMKPDTAEVAFREMVSKQLSQIGLPVPKTWK